MSRFDNEQKKFTCIVKKTNENAVLPKKGYPGSAGYDLFLPRNYGNLTLPAAGSKIWWHGYNLGFCTAFTPGHVALVRDRGSTGTKGIITLAGVVDADYRGEWIIWLANLGDHDYIFNIEKAIAQVLFIPVLDAHMIESAELDTSDRGEKCLGSSDTITFTQELEHKKE
jgi:dUTP pyrophosphatase